MPFPNTIEIIHKAHAERDAFNANEVVIRKLRAELGSRALQRLHGGNEQTEALLVRQNRQIKRGLLELPEIQGRTE